MFFLICVVLGLFMMICLICAAACAYHCWKLQSIPVSVATIVEIERVKSEDTLFYKHLIHPADEPPGVIKTLTTQHQLGEVGDMIPVTYDAVAEKYHDPRELWLIHVGTVLSLLVALMFGCFMYEFAKTRQ